MSGLRESIRTIRHHEQDQVINAECPKASFELTTNCVLSERSQIEHSSEANGTFTFSADDMRISIRSEAMNIPNSFSLSEIQATGSCTFVADSIRISANSALISKEHKMGRSTLIFDGNVVISTNGLTASADSVSLMRIGTNWSLSGLLAAPQDGE